MQRFQIAECTWTQASTSFPLKISSARGGRGRLALLLRSERHYVPSSIKLAEKRVVGATSAGELHVRIGVRPDQPLADLNQPSVVTTSYVSA